MDPLEKKRLANERRLKAIQEQKQRKQQNGFIIPTKITSESTAKIEKKNNFKLFDSDGEEDNNNEDMFKIRPEFEGRNGQQLLEMSSAFSSRFKLDERFKDDEPVKDADAEKNEEKGKNIKILESVLGYEVSEKYPAEKSASNKRQIARFDPEDERVSKYLKISDVSEESKMKTQKKNKKKNMDEIKEEIVPVSKERYIEVSSNLKDLFNSSSSFSLTSKFQSNDLQENEMFEEVNEPFQKAEPLAQKEEPSDKRVNEWKQNKYEAPQKNKYDAPWNNKYGAPEKTNDVFRNRSTYTFFIAGDDSRLKEGVEFFKRPKPIDEIREEWNQSKDRVLELFKMKKRTHDRGYFNKNPITSGKRTFAKKTL